MTSDRSSPGGGENAGPSCPLHLVIQVYRLIRPNGDNDDGEMSGRCELSMRNDDASRPKEMMGSNLKRELPGKSSREKIRAAAIERPVTPTTTPQRAFVARSINKGPHNDGGGGRVSGGLMVGRGGYPMYRG